MGADPPLPSRCVNGTRRPALTPLGADTSPPPPSRCMDGIRRPALTSL